MAISKKLISSAAMLAAVVVGSTAAHATPFGNATASLGGLYGPNVTANTVDLSHSGMQIESASLFSGTGQLNPPGSATVTVSGAFTYSQSIGSIVNDAMSNYLTFSDGSGGTDIFALATVETTAFVSMNNSNAISLYLLGTLSDPSAGLTPTATSITMTLNNNNGGPFTFSATLSDPPTTPVIPPSSSSVPEPASMMILGAGLTGLGLFRRRKA